MKENVPLAVGPTLGTATKYELQYKNWETSGILDSAECQVSIITDAPVIPIQHLTLCAGMAKKAGMTEDANLVITNGCPFWMETEVKNCLYQWGKSRGIRKADRLSLF